MQHAIAMRHIHALIDGKVIVGKPHWMAGTRNEETASLVASLLIVRARMKEQKLWDNDTDNMKKNMQYFLLRSKCCLSRSDTLYKLL